MIWFGYPKHMSRLRHGTAQHGTTICWINLKSNPCWLDSTKKYENQMEHISQKKCGEQKAYVKL